VLFCRHSDNSLVHKNLFLTSRASLVKDREKMFDERWDCFVDLCVAAFRILRADQQAIIESSTILMGDFVSTRFVCVFAWGSFKINVPIA